MAGLYERRIPVAIHCNGDASIDDGLDAIEAAMEAHPGRRQGRSLFMRR